MVKEKAGIGKISDVEDGDMDIDSDIPSGRQP